jgi:hypothetical protein
MSILSIARHIFKIAFQNRQKLQQIATDVQEVIEDIQTAEQTAKPVSDQEKREAEAVNMVNQNSGENKKALTVPKKAVALLFSSLSPDQRQANDESVKHCHSADCCGRCKGGKAY